MDKVTRFFSPILWVEEIYVSFKLLLLVLFVFVEISLAKG